jgi:hypothetical protein
MQARCLSVYSGSGSLEQEATARAPRSLNSNDEGWRYGPYSVPMINAPLSSRRCCETLRADAGYRFSPLGCPVGVNEATKSYVLGPNFIEDVAAAWFIGIGLSANSEGVEPCKIVNFTS